MAWAVVRDRGGAHPRGSRPSRGRRPGPSGPGATLLGSAIGRSARVLAGLQESQHAGAQSAIVLPPSGTGASPAATLRGSWGVIEPSSAAFDVNRVRDVGVNAFNQVLAVKPALGVAGGGPVKARLDRGPVLLVGAPAAEDRHIVRVRPQALLRLGVALDESPQGVEELAGEFVPVGDPGLLMFVPGRGPREERGPAQPADL